MGIRFYCPNGHKLHVKAFQAGRRGVCPYCGVPIDIPLVSTRDSSKTDKPSGHKAHNESDAINLNAIAPSEAPSDAAGRSFTATGQDKEIELSAPLDRPVSVPLAPIPTPVEVKKIDPFEEAPKAVWYVRPASGGQYGPASSEIMKSWLDEGRVADDSMVWREGWSDWKDAAEVFEQLTPQKLNINFTPVANKVTSKSTGKKKSKAEPVSIDESESTFNWKEPKLITIIVESVVIIALIIALIFK